jgi:hypothetical protein
MSRRLGAGDAHLERSLRDLGPLVAFPATPDLSARVTAAIRTEGRAPVSRPQRRPARAFAFASGLAVVALLGLALTPATRDAVADFLGIGGVRIETGHGAAPTPTAAPGTNLRLGERTTLEDARDRVEFSVLLPDVLGLANPDEVYVADFPPGGRVSLVYRARGWLPKANQTGIGLLITEFEGTLEGDIVKKLSGMQQVVPTDVNGAPALWVRGEHPIFYLDAKGNERTETLRLSANALVWTRGTTTLRIESSLNLADTLTIAESMR